MAKSHGGARRRRDIAANVAFSPTAPQVERTAALGELQKAHLPRTLSDLIAPPENIREVIDFMRNDLEQGEVLKSIRSNVVPFPSRNRGKPGMQSVQLDDMYLSVQGDWWEKPGLIGFDQMRMMVEQTPILNAIVMTRQRQVQGFCRAQESGRGPGFAIRHTDSEHKVGEDEAKRIAQLQKFIANCGWEFSPRARKRLRRDSFPQFMAKLVRETLTLDSAPIETEFKRNRSLGIDGLYAVDGATIRLCTERGYQGDDEIFALQVVQGRICTAYTFDDLIYEPRNPRADVMAAGYGLGEPELLVRTVTGFLNAMTLNLKGFTDNAIPRGVLHLTGNYAKEDVVAFKRYWNAMVKGINNAWTVPVMISQDRESKASFENFGVEFDEMYFSKWMTFLASLVCAIYSIDPTEINFESFAADKSSLSGSDTSERLAASKDKGLKPLLSYFEQMFTDYIVTEFNDDWVFRWTGLDEDQKARDERAKLTLTVDEMRAEDGRKPMDSPLGSAPVNQSLIGPWMQIMQAQAPKDFGQPAGESGDPAGGHPGDPGSGADEEGGIGGEQGSLQPGQDDPRSAADDGQGGPAAKEPLQKAKALDFGVPLPPVYEVEA